MPTIKKKPIAVSQIVGALIGAVAIATAYWMVGEQTEAAREQSSRVCHQPLSELCQGGKCANYTENRRSVRAREGQAFHAETGTCGELMYSEWHDARGGEWAYFDVGGDLIMARVWNQQRLYCEASSQRIQYGPDQGCTRKTTQVFFTTEGEDKPRLYWPEDDQ